MYEKTPATRIFSRALRALSIHFLDDEICEVPSTRFPARKRGMPFELKTNLGRD